MYSQKLTIGGIKMVAEHTTEELQQIIEYLNKRIATESNVDELKSLNTLLRVITRELDASKATNDKV